MKISEYNRAISIYAEGNKNCDKVVADYNKRLKQLEEDGEKAIQEATDKLTDSIEEIVFGWSGEDYDSFIETASHDSMIGYEGILLFSSAYAKMHSEDKERLHNSECKIAMLRMALEQLVK